MRESFLRHSRENRTLPQYILCVSSAATAAELCPDSPGTDIAASDKADKSFLKSLSVIVHERDETLFIVNSENAGG